MEKNSVHIEKESEGDLMIALPNDRKGRMAGRLNHRNSFIIKIFVVMFVLAGSFLACKKTPLENPANFFAVNGELSVPLTKGYIIDYGPVGFAEDQIRHMHVDLLDDGITFDPVTLTYSGTGNRLNIEFNSPEDGHLASGSYNYEVSDTIHIFTFQNGFIEENIDYANQTGHHHDITSGSVVVVHNPDNSTYDFTFNCSLSTGKQFVGTYKGALNYDDATNIQP